MSYPQHTAYDMEHGEHQYWEREAEVRGLTQPTDDVVDADTKALQLMCEYTCAKDWEELVVNGKWNPSDVHAILMKSILKQLTERNQK